MTLSRILRTHLPAIAGLFVASALAAGASAQTSTPASVRNVVLVPLCREASTSGGAL